MKEEMERLNELVDWYKCKLKEIIEAPVDRDVFVQALNVT